MAVSEDGRLWWDGSSWRELSQDGTLGSLGTAWRSLTEVIQEKYPEKQAERFPDPDPMLSPQEIRTLYNAGLDWVISKLPSRPNVDEDVGMKWLRDLATFRQHGLLWAVYGAEADTNGNYGILTLESGIYNGGLLVVAPPGHPLAKGPTLQVLPRSDLNMLQILPFAMTREWAGIALIHELEHLENFATGQEPRPPSRSQYLDGEVRAFSAEIAAFQLVTGSRFIPTVVGLYRLFSSAAGNPTEGLSQTQGGHMMQALALEADALLGCPPPQSSAEAATRLGFYFVAGSLVTAGVQASNPDIIEVRRKVIEVYYQPTGQLPSP
ncbi:MAG: hypothetical protein AUI56_04645 [Actinobacteria bacterium 13_1_40CM_2_66_13]|nr:MAG: hypothetical protein AUI56_04645 [Actinobacteria bacterium 13_1_40CM_2_66_13]